MVILKDNHIDFAGGITAAVEQTKAYLEAKGKRIPIEVEVRSLDDVREVAPPRTASTASCSTISRPNSRVRPSI